jgi:hypothetical protein
MLAVATRRLASLPDAGRGRPLAQALEALGVHVELHLRDPEQDGALQPACGGRGVDALADDDDPAADRLDPVPDGELLTHVPAEPGQIGHHDPGVLALLDALDRLAQRRSSLERQAARHVELGGKDPEGHTQLSRVRPEVLELLAIGVDIGCPGLPLAHMANTHDARVGPTCHQG